jgi:hypothetical protein
MVLYGCRISHLVPEFKSIKRWDHSRFDGEAPYIALKLGGVIYIPDAYNYKAVDEMIVHIWNQNSKDKKGKAVAVRKAIIMGVQITIASHHSNS